MSRDADFERFARDAAQGTILALRRMGGATFTESDRRAMVDGLDVIREAQRIRQRRYYERHREECNRRSAECQRRRREAMRHDR